MEPDFLLQPKAISELAATATAMTVAKCVAKDALYFKTWWHGNLAIAANSDLALTWLHWSQWGQQNGCLCEIGEQIGEQI